MHLFPQASELQFLVGLELRQVCFAPWQIQFNFDKARIFVEGDLEHIDKAGTLRRHNMGTDRLSPIYLHHLLGQKVGSIEVAPLKLTLAFDGGDIIRILSEVGPYECGQIHDRDDQLIVVF